MTAIPVLHRPSLERRPLPTRRPAAVRRDGPLDLEEADRRLCPAPLRGLLERARGEEAAARPSAARHLYERVLHGLAGEENAYVAACVMRWIARTLMTEGDLEGAQDVLETSLAVAGRCDSHLGMARALNFLGAIAQLTGRVDEAAGYYQRALDRAAVAGDRQLIAMVEQNLGVLAADLQGRHDLALEHFSRALRGYTSLGLDGRAAEAWTNIGKAYTAIGRYKRARRAHGRALVLCERAGDRPNALRARANLAELHVTRGRYAEAERLCAQLLAAAEAGASPWIAEAHLYTGIAARESGRPDEAEGHFIAAARIATQRNDPLLGAEAAREHAVLLAQQHRNAESFARLQLAYTQFERLRARPGLADIEERFSRFERQFLDTVEQWGRSLEAMDPYTHGHSGRVAELATSLADAVGYDRHTLFWFRIGALLHDIGKIRMPLEVLTKPGRLTASERAIVQRHPEDGVAVLGGIEFPWDVRPMIRGHHEKWNGAGYPDQLAAEQIPLSARILTLADVYDALTTSRSYRPAFSHEAAITMMRGERGTTFDPILLDRFLEIVRDRDCAPAAEPALPVRRAATG